MVSDTELYVLRHTQLRDMDRNVDAANYLADLYNLSVDSVRGRLSRASTPANRVAVLKTLASEVPDVSPAVARQLAVIARSKTSWDSSNQGHRTLVFLSDAHLAQARWDAYQLALEVCDYVQPHFITAMNDALDNKGFGRWLEVRSVRGQVWTSDDMNLRAVEREHYKNLNAVSTHGLPAVVGNHDNWYYKYLRENSPQTAESTIASYMEGIERQGVLQFERGYRENVLELSPAVVVWHGTYTQKNQKSLAKSNIEHFMQNGVARSVVCGHTHRPHEEQGVSIGYSGVKFINNGALTDYTPYLKRHPHAHGLGITVIDYDTDSRFHEMTLIRFTERDDRMIANYQGRQFSVPIDKQHRDDFQ